MNDVIPTPRKRKPYEYRGGVCETHGNRCAMRRERGAGGEWSCVECEHEAGSLLPVCDPSCGVCETLAQDLAPAPSSDQQSPPAAPSVVEAASPADALETGGGACALPSGWRAHAKQWGLR